MSDVDLSKYHSYFVVEQEDDPRKVGRTIASELAAMGFQSSVGKVSGAPKVADVLVRYEATWHWDITPYLFVLHIRFQDADSLLPLATATSEHSSTTRVSQVEMVKQVLTNLFSGVQRTSENDFYDEVLAADMYVSLETLTDKSLPIGVQVNGFGTQLASDEAFNEALTKSLRDQGIFDSISDDHAYLLYVALNSVVIDHSNWVIFGIVTWHNATATASWVLKEKVGGKILYRSEIITNCPENEVHDYNDPTELTACVIRENFRSGFEELAELTLD